MCCCGHNVAMESNQKGRAKKRPIVVEKEAIPTA